MIRLLRAILITLSLAFASNKSIAQLYFPPLAGSSWDTISPASLGWCADSINSLYAFLDAKHTKGFLVLKDGKIVLEKYFGTFTKDSNWYWASAGKSLTATMVGIAQDNNLVDINNPVSNYIGNAWSVAPAAKEQLITVKHLLSMSSGLKDNPNNSNCTDDTCLKYFADAGTRWSYYNAAYYKLFDVLTTAYGSGINVITNNSIKSKIGMQGVWLPGEEGFGYIYYSTVRSMARFGLLNLNNCIWNNDTLIKNTSYVQAAKNTSQIYNKSYGYLWWLNGKGTYMSPGFQAVINSNLVPTAPADMYTAMGKNDQRAYIVPSQNMVVIRMGEAADGSLAAISPFDEDLWTKINNLKCNAPLGVTTPYELNKITVSPNPATDMVNIFSPYNNQSMNLVTSTGQIMYSITDAPHNVQLNMHTLNSGIYFLKIVSASGIAIHKILKQ